MMQMRIKINSSAPPEDLREGGPDRLQGQAAWFPEVGRDILAVK
jgi:hypothetical protein